MAVPFTYLDKYIAEIYKTMRSSGLFLSSGFEHANTIPMSFLMFGTFCNRPVALAPIRVPRYTHELLEQTGVFTLSVPRKDLTRELSAAGIISGREHDKFTELHLHPAKARRVSAYIVADCGLHLECRVIYKDPIITENLAPDVINELHHRGSNYTMYYGEILDIYET